MASDAHEVKLNRIFRAIDSYVLVIGLPKLSKLSEDFLGPVGPTYKNNLDLIISLQQQSLYQWVAQKVSPSGVTDFQIICSFLPRVGNVNGYWIITANILSLLPNIKIHATRTKEYVEHKGDL